MSGFAIYETVEIQLRPTKTVQPAAVHFQRTNLAAGFFFSLLRGDSIRYPRQSVGEWVIDSFTFGDSYRISKLVCSL